MLCDILRLTSFKVSFKFIVMFSLNFSVRGMAIYFGSPFGRYPTFHTLDERRMKKAFSMLKGRFRFSSYSEVL